MEVKSAILYGKIEEEVYVCQPLGFEDLDLPDRVYKVEKALYGLHQAPKAWFTEVKTASTPMETQKPLLKDEDGEEVDVHMYRYLKVQLKLGIWYPKDSPFDLVAYTDSDYAGASLDRKSTTREAEYVAASSCCGQVLWIQNQLLDYGEKKLIQMVKIHTDKNVADLLTKAFDLWSTVKANTINKEVQLHALVDDKKIIITESTVRRDLQLEDAKGVECLPNSTIFEQLTLMGLTFYKPFFSPQWKFLIHTILQFLSSKNTAWNEFSSTMASIPQSSDPSDNVEDEAIHKELGDSLVRAATIASSLEAEQDSGNITKTRSKATPNESSSLGTTSGGGPGAKKPWGILLLKLGLRMYLNILMIHCSQEVLDLEKTKTTQANEIASLKRRVKKLEKKNRSRTHRLKRLYKVGLTAMVESFGDEESLGEDASKQDRIIAIDVDEEIALVSVQDDADKEMFDVDALNGEEVFVAGQNENIVEEVGDVAQVSTAATTVTITTEEITLAQALEALKTSKPKVKGIVFQEPGKSTTTTTISSQQSQDKAEFDKEERLVREKAEKEANIALIETWDDIQAKIDADHQLAERLQAQEQEELSDAEKATLFQQLLEKRRKHFAAKRAEEKRNKPPTKAQQRENIILIFTLRKEGLQAQ
ncbi:uncharacterized mitochondrial protein-like protein [Tanacetum coccineum]